MSTYHVILPAIYGESVEDRLEAFDHALAAMERAHSWGRTFVLSDGVRPLVVSSPGGPLMLPDRLGRLVVAPEQDLRELLHSLWGR